MTNYNISIISDTVCPWCYIGLRRLQAAITDHLSKYPGDSFALQWKPFQLNPNAPKGQTVDKMANYEKNFGADQIQVVFDRLRSGAEGTGIKFSFKGRTGNTIDSHRLIEFARLIESKDQRQGVCQPSGMRSLQTRLVEELFSAYFEQEKDITSHDVLVEAAGRAGMYEKEARVFLESDRLANEVEAQAIDSRNVEGVNGVPHFTINGMFDVGGAQEPRAYGMLFERVKKREASARGSNL
jgi:predicted DsbA family dithiol-disulfide isomerase